MNKILASIVIGLSCMLLHAQAPSYPVVPDSGALEISDSRVEPGRLVDGTESQIRKDGEKQSRRPRSITGWEYFLALAVFFILALSAYLLHKRWIGRIKSLTSSSVEPTAPPADHSLILSLADRISFMEMTLHKMDPSVKGYKQLKHSVAQMKDNLAADGYEIVDMLGKPYHEGMKSSVSFEDDDTLEPGTRIITNVIKPQINYKGVMVQASQITVSQNIR